MYYELTGECCVLTTKWDLLDDTTKYEEILKGKTFDDTDSMDQFINDLEAKNNILFDSFEFTEMTSDEEDEEDWDNTIASALAESEATGQPFDHIMGEVLGGVR